MQYLTQSSWKIIDPVQTEGKIWPVILLVTLDIIYFTKHYELVIEHAGKGFGPDFSVIQWNMMKERENLPQ